MAKIKQSAYEKKDALKKTGRRFSPGVGGFVQWSDKQTERMLSIVSLPDISFEMTDASIRRISECVKDNAEIRKPFLTEYKARSIDGTEYVFETEVRDSDGKIQTNSSLYRKNPYETASSYDPVTKKWGKDQFLDRILNTEGHGTELIDAVREGAGCGLIRFGTDNLWALIDACADLFMLEDLIGETAEAGIAEIFDNGESDLMPVLVPKSGLITGSWIIGSESGSSVLCRIDPEINVIGRNAYYPLHGEGFITPVIESENNGEFAKYIAKLWAPPEEGVICERIPSEDWKFTEKKKSP